MTKSMTGLRRLLLVVAAALWTPAISAAEVGQARPAAEKERPDAREPSSKRGDASAQPSTSAAADIDWTRARALHDRASRGEKLSDEDQAYVERAKRAMAARQAAKGGAERSPAGPPPKVDWSRVGQLYDKVRGGQTPTADEQAELIRAAQALQALGPLLRDRSGRAGEARPGSDIDWNRAKGLYQKSQHGEKLSDEDQAYLDRAKRLMEQGKGPRGDPQRGGQQTPPPPATDHTGLIPLDQMTAKDSYKGQDGGLYGGGKNVPPPQHQQAAQRELAQVVRRDSDGKPAADGTVVLISIGMSNTTQEFSRFKELADQDPAKWSQLVIVDGAQGGQDAERWSTPDLPAWTVLGQRLQQAGVTPAQVQVAWLKQARMGPSRCGEYPKHAEELMGHIRASLLVARQKFPNLRVVYLSSRIYAGYATTGLNPEPYAYEGGLAVRRLILEQVRGAAGLNCDPAKGEVQAPLLLWGPYLWADGTTPRKSDGLIYNRDDLGPDGTHPSRTEGREKVGRLLLEFFKAAPLAKGWFLGPATAAK